MQFLWFFTSVTNEMQTGANSCQSIKEDVWGYPNLWSSEPWNIQRHVLTCSEELKEMRSMSIVQTIISEPLSRPRQPSAVNQRWNNNWGGEAFVTCGSTGRCIAGASDAAFPLACEDSERGGTGGCCGLVWADCGEPWMFFLYRSSA